MPDYISKKKLKRKVIERWENEGGRLCDEKRETPESTTQRGRESNALLLSRDGVTDEDDNSAVEKHEPFIASTNQTNPER